MNARVIVEAATVAMDILTSVVAKRQRLGDGGTIDPRDAEALDASLTSAFFAVMAPYCTSAKLAVSRTADITGGRLAGAITVKPFGYATDIDFTVGMTR
jgi:hypothetical protein